MYAKNLDAFKKPLTPTSQYLAGLVLADGNVWVKGNNKPCGIRLGMNDREALVCFRDHLSPESPIRKRSSKRDRTFRVDVCSAEMCRDMIALGIGPNKIVRGCDFDPSLQGSRHFWAGVVDGDGHIMSGQYIGLSLANSDRSVIERFLSLVEPYGYTAKKVKNKNCYTGSVYGDGAFYLLSLLYTKTDGVFRLPRKKKTALEFIQRRVEK